MGSNGQKVKSVYVVASLDFLQIPEREREIGEETSGQIEIYLPPCCVGH